MRLTVKQLKTRDPGSGMAEIDRTVPDEPDVSSGDFVAIEGPAVDEPLADLCEPA